MVLGVPVQGQEPPSEALLRFLADREVLLVLDNFEHLLDGGAAALRSCSRAAPG